MKIIVCLLETFNTLAIRQHLKCRVLQPNVTGYWKTDHNVTLGQLQFIGPANSHTHALPMHNCIIGLS